MTDQEHEPDVPAPDHSDSDSQETEADDQPSEETEAAAILPPKRFRARTEENLYRQRFMLADEDAAAIATLSEGSIGSKSGNAKFLGGVITRLATALGETAKLHRAGVSALSDALLSTVAWENSVTLVFLVADGEEVRFGADGLRHSPSLDAARDLFVLLSAEPVELLPRAVQLGPNAIGAYRNFLNVLASDAVTFELSVPEVPQAVEVTSDHARRDAALLKQPGQRVTQRLTVQGKLTMADSSLKKFKLTLPADKDERHPVLASKRQILGDWPEALGQKLHDLHLWDEPVTAVIEMTVDFPETTATPRQPEYVLIDAEPLGLPSAEPMF